MIILCYVLLVIFVTLLVYTFVEILLDEIKDYKDHSFYRYWQKELKRREKSSEGE